MTQEYPSGGTICVLLTDQGLHSRPESLTQTPEVDHGDRDMNHFAALERPNKNHQYFIRGAAAEVEFTSE